MSYSTSIRDGPLGILPIDVYEHIMDCVHSSCLEEDEVRTMQMTLYSCALTCRAWHPRSRFLLYQSLMVYSYRVYARNQDAVRRLAHTITLSPFIADLVQHVTVYEVSPSRSGIASTLPLLLVNRLPKLRTMTIQYTCLLVNAAFCHSMASFPALTTVTLSYVMLASVTAFRRLLAALPRLYDLRLDRVAFETRGMWETGALYENQMPRVRWLSIIATQDELPVLPLLARHVERLAISFNVLKGNASLDGLVFDHLTSLTIRSSYGPFVDDVTEFFSRARADMLQTITVTTLEMDMRSIVEDRKLLETFGERCLLEQLAVLRADLRRLESVTVVLVQTQYVDYKEDRVAEILEEWMPAAVKECREALSVLHRRGLLRVAAAAQMGRRQDGALVCVWPEEGAQAVPSYTRQFGVPVLLDAIVNVLEKMPRKT
ncbi:hypothetical protein GSI_13354 [Ganoderma sinense ZZ0214-1]|uniref:F-box domain-containing protein n=1 Tax=Ganoderma sinense ZZ0214-1 TaxID=1077348 RepID=A0A2G8RVF3_9APHY|nr:hypothetical protein GSI_13354 [Ganoderma sinense ZZ0214-1]